MDKRERRFGSFIFCPLIALAAVVLWTGSALGGSHDRGGVAAETPDASKPAVHGVVTAANEQEYRYLDDGWEDDELRDVLSRKWDAAAGQEIYSKSCVRCHGKDGKGAIPAAPDFTQSTGRLIQGDAILMVHIERGFQSEGSDEAMPPKGGNPALSMEDIMNVLTHLKRKFYFQVEIRPE